MSDIKLKAASGGGSISLKGPSSAGSDTDFLAANGDVNVSGDISIPADNKKLLIGAGDDFEIFHDGSNTRMYNNTGSLFFRASDFYFQDHTGDENIAKFIDNGAIELYYDNNKCLETRPDGGIEATDGNFIVGTSGHGIQFDTGDSGSANLLDEYEEGTYTPTVHGWSASGTATYNSQSGSYIKVGKQVTVWGNIDWSAISNASGVHALGGLPYAHTSDAYAGACWVHCGNMGDNIVSGFVGNGQGNSILLYLPTTGAQNYMSVDTNGGYCKYTCTYIANT